ncbi:MAG: TadE/TadG family type IV pilus assembly protein [Lautropia sp.]|nr:TadE/TadG family type IV pilus assembly protein [Lautropia sp.]
MSERHRLSTSRGVSSVELIIALPVLLLLLLGIIQFVLVFHAKHSLDHALNEAARQGAMAHADPSAIKQGLARGLAPWLYGATDWASKVMAEGKALGEVEIGMQLGWIQLAQRSPTRESFDDWAEPALDGFGERIRGVDEIPNDNLDNRRLKAQPRSGTAGHFRGEPVGQRSGQTLGDANLLRLEMDYGVRLSVPFVGRIVLGVLSEWHGCGDQSFYLPGTADVCRYYKARSVTGKADGRIPVKVVATTRMMSPARRSEWLQAAITPPPQRASTAGTGIRPIIPPPTQGQDEDPARPVGVDLSRAEAISRAEDFPALEPDDGTEALAEGEEGAEEEGIEEDGIEEEGADEEGGDPEGDDAETRAAGPDRQEEEGRAGEVADDAAGNVAGNGAGNGATSPRPPWADLVRPRAGHGVDDSAAPLLTPRPEHPAVCTAADQGGRGEG